jgi:hypothetical protein
MRPIRACLTVMSSDGKRLSFVEPNLRLGAT